MAGEVVVAALCVPPAVALADLSLGNGAHAAAVDVAIFGLFAGRIVWVGQGSASGRVG
jgi:hypothetical protein